MEKLQEVRDRLTEKLAGKALQYRIVAVRLGAIRKPVKVKRKKGE